MNRYEIYQQGRPIAVRAVQVAPHVTRVFEWGANLQHVGYVMARSAGHAIGLACKLPTFLQASGLGRFPIVAGGPREESEA